jgi:hypothetical protein
MESLFLDYLESLDRARGVGGSVDFSSEGAVLGPHGIDLLAEVAQVAQQT